jgi:2-oxoisovalerate dehydrogenase E1 component
MDVPAVIPPVPFGQARIRRAGADLTVVTWGNTTEPVLEAARRLQEEVDVEVIDLRTIVPWDQETVLKSIQKTGRLVVVQEDSQSCSVGQMIIAEMLGNEDRFGNFLAAPRLVSKPDVHIGYNPIYEYGCLPSTADVMRAIREVAEN